MANEYDAIANKMFNNKDVAPVEAGGYEAIAQQKFEPSKNNFQSSQFVAQKKDPEKTNEALKLSRELQMPVDFVERNLDKIKSKKPVQESSYESIVEKSPKLAKWMEDPYKASISNDDVEQLSRVERNANRIRPYKEGPSYMDDLGGAVSTGYNNLENSGMLLGAAYGMVDINTIAQAVADRNQKIRNRQNALPTYAKEFQKIMEREGNDVDISFKKFKGSFQKFKENKILEGLLDFGSGGLMTVAESLDQFYEAAKKPKGLFRSTLESLAFSAPALATGVAGAKGGAVAGGAIGTALFPGAGTATGATVGGIAGFATGTFAGSAATEVGAWINQSLEERGYDTANADDLVRAYGNKKLMIEVRGEAERKGLTTAGVDALFSIVAGKFLKGAKGSGKIATAKAFTKDVGVQSIGEGGSEFAGQIAAREGDFSKVSLGEAVFEGIASMGHSVGEVGIRGGVRIGGELSAGAKSIRSTLNKKVTVAAEQLTGKVNIAQESISELQALEQLGEVAKESKLQTRDPEAFAEFVAEANVDGGADQSVYFQKDQWDEYWQSKGESPVAKAEELLGTTEAYDNADQAGQPIGIPLKDYLSKMGDKPEFGELLQIVQTKPDGMTVSEATEVMTSLPDTLEELAQEAQSEKELMDQVEVAGQEIKKRLEAQLVEAGRDKIEAVPLTAFYQTMGVKEGINPLELAEKYGLQVKKVSESGVESGDKVLDQKEKGRIRISGNDKFTIELLANADKSTFLHESGHYFLEVTKDMASMEQASPELKEDFRAIRDWMGLKDGQEIQTEHHEKWARGFEQYLRDGKAPSAKLRKAFNTFKVWLTSIYRSALQLDVELSPEIRDVMDRMFATQEEIEQAKENMNDFPLFVDPIEAGMTEKQAQAYREAVGEADMSAKEELESKALKVVERRKALEKKINIQQIEKQLSEQPLYKAIDQLKSKESIDGAPPLKFDQVSFNQTFPEFKGNKKFRGMFTKDDTGLSPDFVATLLGFEKASDLVNSISNSPTKKEAAEIQASQIVDEQFAKEESAESLSEAADKALHNMSRAKRLRMEYDHLSRGLQNETTRRIVRRPVPDAEIKGVAEKIINNMAVGTIRPNQYRLAERRYAKEAGKLLVAKDIEGAFMAKQRELLNHYLYRQSQDAKQFIKKGEKASKKFFDKDEKISKTRDMDLVGAARAVLARYGLGNSKKDALAQIAKIKEYNPDAYETVSSIIIGLVDDPDVYTNIEYGRFKDLMDGVDSLWSLSKDVKEIEIDGKKLSINIAIKELSENLNSFKSKKNSSDNYKRNASKHDKWQIKMLGLKAQFRRLEHWVDVMDAGKIDGPFRKYIVTPVSEATDLFSVTNKKFKERFVNLSKPIEKTINYNVEIKASEFNFAFKDKSEILGALLHTGNDSNKKKLLVGRGWGMLDEDGNLVTAKWDKFIQRMWDEGVLTKADYDYMQSVWDLMEEIKPMGQKAHKKVFGYYFEEITNNEFETPFGKYKGGYAPAAIDPNAATDIARKQELEAFIKAHPSNTWPAAGGRGHTKSRNEQFAKPLNINISLVGRHITDSLKFAIIKPAVVDAAKIVTSQEFKSRMGEIDPKVIEVMIKPALNRADKNQISQSDPSKDPTMIKFANTIKNTAAMQLMFANVTNTVEQVAGLSVAATRIRPSYIAMSTARFTASPKETAAAIREKSNFMASRTDDQIFEMDKIATDIFAETTKFQDAKNFAKKHAYFTQAFTQNIVDFSVWQASYDESTAGGMTEKQAVRKADADIRMTQTSRRAFDVSNFETDEWLNVFNMFYNFFNTMWNLNVSNFSKLYQEDLGLGRKSAKGFYLLMMGYSSIAIISASVKKAAAGGLDEDEDNEYADDLYDVFIGSQIDLGFAMIPVFGSALNAGIKEYAGGKPYETRMSASPAVSLMAAATRAAGKVAKGDFTDGDLKNSEIRDGLTGLGMVTGLPLRALSKPGIYLKDVQSGKARPSGPIDAFRGLVTGKPGVK